MSDEDELYAKTNYSSLLEFAKTVHQSFEDNPRGTIKAPEEADTILVQDPNFIQLDDLDTTEGFLQLHSGPDSESSGFNLTILDPIGSGGMANVDSATQHSLKREIALKRPREDRVNPQIADSMIREAQLMAQLDHPNIPPVHQLAFGKDGNPIILMKRVRGVSWSTLLHEPWHPYWANQTERHLKSHLQILRQVCHALEYAHDKGIVHRDLKTENVMVGDYGEVYLLDWGVAVELDEDGYHQATHFCGTPCFAAPEMFSATTPLSTYTDVYLLGGVLHELLTRKVLHTGQSFDEIIDQVRVSAPYEYYADIHPTLAKIANKSTALRPADRYQNVQSFREAIEDHLEHYQAVELLNSTITKMASLEEMVLNTEKDGFHFHQLAFECRFGFHRVSQVAPDLDGPQKGLLRVLELQTKYELSQGRVDAPRQMLRLMEKMDPEFDGLKELREKFTTLEKQKEASRELTTQIQYKLLEELQKKKQD